MDISQIRKLIKLVQSSDVTEIEITEGESTVRISRHTGVAPVMAAAPAVAEYAAAAAPAAALTAAAPAEEANSNEEHQVTSPMVGTAYLQPEPGTPAFVSVGDSVTEGQTLCIVEAMKTMNQIPSPHAGKVKRILIEDGAPVEFGAPLIIIE